MKGKIILFWLVLIGGAGAFLFQTAYQVQGLEEELVSLNRQIVREQESIQILKAEWSYLNTPTRLEKLAREYLQLQPSEARQFVAKADSVPMRPEQPIPSEIIRAPRLPVAMPLPTALPPAALPSTVTPAAAPAAPAAGHGSNHGTATARTTAPVAAPAVIPAAAPAPVKAPKTTGPTALASIPAAGPAAVVAPRVPAPAVQQASTVRPPQPSAPAATAKPQNPSPTAQRAPQPAAARGGAGTGGDDPMGMLIARLGGTR